MLDIEEEEAPEALGAAYEPFVGFAPSDPEPHASPGRRRVNPGAQARRRKAFKPTHLAQSHISWALPDEAK
eukprot:scaffold23302_cov44-Phaeocystis_antarctica.AAC.1